MPKFVTFDDGYGQFNFRGIFPSSTSKKEIVEAVRRKLKKNLRCRGLEEGDFEWEILKDGILITNMKEGIFYEPKFGSWED